MRQEVGEEAPKRPIQYDNSYDMRGVVSHRPSGPVS